MYIIQNKSQLNQFVRFFHKELTNRYNLSPKTSKLREIIAHCFEVKSYSSLIAHLPIQTIGHEDKFSFLLHDKLSKEPFGLPIDEYTVSHIFDEALIGAGDFDYDALETSLQLAAYSV